MKRVWIVGVFVAGGLFGGGFVAVSHEFNRSIGSLVSYKTPVLRVLAEQADAWNRGDLDGFMAGYLNSPDLTFRSGGTVTKGYDETLARYRKKYQAPGAEMGRLRFSEITIAPFRKIAFVTGRWTLDRSADTPTGLFTLRLDLTADGWKIVDDHTSAAEPTPQKVKNPEKK